MFTHTWRGDQERALIPKLIGIYFVTMKENPEGSYLPSLYTPNAVIPFQDFQILEWALKKSYPAAAALRFTDEQEFRNWQRGPQSWPFCDTVARLICDIYPEAYLAYDYENNHIFNFVPKIGEKNIPVINFPWVSENDLHHPEVHGLTPIDLARDQFVHYDPQIYRIENPSLLSDLYNLSTNTLTEFHHQQIRQFVNQHPQVEVASERLLVWVKRVNTHRVCV